MVASSVSQLLAFVGLAVFVCNAEDFWSGKLKSLQLSPVASAVFPPLDSVDQDQQAWQMDQAPSGMAFSDALMDQTSSVVSVPQGLVIERFTHDQIESEHYPMRGVPHIDKMEQVPHNWQANSVSHGQLAEGAPHEQLVDWSQHDWQVDWAPHGQLVESVPHDWLAEEVPHGQLVERVPHDWLAEEVPHGQLVERVPHDWQANSVPHGQLVERVPHDWQANSVPHGQLVERVPHDWQANSVPHGQLVERVPHDWQANSVPHGQLVERVPHDWQVDWAPHDQLDDQVFSETADDMVPPVVRAPQYQQPVLQAPSGVQVLQAHTVPQTPLKILEATYTRPLVRSVVAECRENSVLVMVKQDLLGIGELIQPSDVTLGGCAPTGQNDTAGVLVFQTELQNCGSKLTMTSDALIYTFTMLYEPHPVGGAPIVRTNRASVNVECHYLRLHNVSSSAIKPTWIPLIATRKSEDRLVFSLKLMSDDWQSERTSNAYSLGDVINVEASVSVAHHVPLRVFVDSCVATLVPDVKAVPRYPFIENHGCLMDARLTGSRSQFMHRRKDNKLQFQLDAFRFSGDPRSSIYMTCLLKATTATARRGFQYKACSFFNRWVSASGHDQVCDCCDASCSQRKGRSLDYGSDLKSEVCLGPIMVHELRKHGR